MVVRSLSFLRVPFRTVFIVLFFSLSSYAVNRESRRDENFCNNFNKSIETKNIERILNSYPIWEERRGNLYSSSVEN